MNYKLQVTRQESEHVFLCISFFLTFQLVNLNLNLTWTCHLHSFIFTLPPPPPLLTALRPYTAAWICRKEARLRRPSQIISSIAFWKTHCQSLSTAIALVHHSLS